MKKKILITGSAGFIGSYLFSYLTRRKFEVRGIDIKKSGSNLEKNIIYDISDKKLLDRQLEIFNPDVIIHCAAIKSLTVCEEKKEEALKSNVLSTGYIANYASTHPVKVIYISSDVVFNGDCGDYLERDNVDPINWYGKTKAFSEIIVRRLPNFAICRTALVIGNLTAEYKEILRNELNNDVLVNQTLLPQYIYHRFKRRSDVVLPSKVISNPTPIDLLSYFILKIIQKDATGIFHTVGPNSVSRYEVAKIIADIFKFDSKHLKEDNINISPLRPRNISLNSEITYRILGINSERWQLKDYLLNKKLYKL